MAQKWLAALSVLAALAAGSAKADVIYTFFDARSPSTVDLDFTVAAQLSPANSTEPLLSTSGVFAFDFVGGTAGYNQGPPAFVPFIFANGANNFVASEIFTGFPVGNPANGVPGNGTFPVDGKITNVPNPNPVLAVQSIATISGIPVPPVPEPSTIFLLATGLVGLMGFASQRCGA